MLSLFTSLITPLAGWINMLISWWRKRQDDQIAAVDDALTQHQNDGAQSELDQVSSDAQNAALDAQEALMDQSAVPAPQTVEVAKK